MGAVGCEVLNDKITFGDHVLYGASPVRKGLAKQRSRLRHALRPIRGIGRRLATHSLLPVDAVFLATAVFPATSSHGEMCVTWWSDGTHGLDSPCGHEIYHSP